MTAYELATKVNDLLFAQGAPLGSEAYFAIRTLCTDLMKSVEQLEPLPAKGVRIPMVEFMHLAHNGLLLDSDGHGYLATGRKVSKLLVKPSSVKQSRPRLVWTHVLWFNA